MTKTSTKNELLRFLYRECTETEEQDLKRSMIHDEALQEDFFEFRALQKKLDKVTLRAPQSVIDKILQEARQIDLESA